MAAPVEPKAAGGAALDQIAIATGGAAVLTAALLLGGWAHRTGRTQVLATAAAYFERARPTRGLPGWVGLPTIAAMVSLITALLGMYWDISLHISAGRDEGPLANIAHYPILIRLFGIFASGVLAIFAVQYAWSQVAFPLPWTPDMLGEGLASALLGGVAGGVVGALTVLGLRGRLPRPAVSRSLLAASLVLVAVAAGNPPTRRWPRPWCPPTRRSSAR